ncbi:hypothetical protein [Nitrosophilus kaiyonis]|uniref:hypothetical protein n=1 Tax=Nitrosophilus kaiyonis TaxID=2930200 RepID=UPI00248FCA34|nr:hypothetical protein [Nitrosophilus kaiyonis]
MKKLLVLISVSLLLFSAENSIKVIKSGNNYIVVKKEDKKRINRKDKERVDKKIDLLQEKIKKLKKENIELSKNLNECNKNLSNKYLIVYKINPKTYRLIKKCGIENIDRDILFFWGKNKEFTSFLKDNNNRLKITGIFLKGKWQRNLKDLWIDKKCVEAKK